MTIIPSIRLVPDNETVLQQLGALSALVGTWEGSGFNLVARPDFHDRANLYLQLNQTRETLAISPIGAAIPNRGFGQDDISLHGVNYLQKISDQSTGGALHFEPGLWITQPDTAFPLDEAPAGESLVSRMGSIPHGNALLASGTAGTMTGDPVLTAGTTAYNGSLFPSFNSTPFGAAAPEISAAGSSQAGTAAANPGRVIAFDEYNLAVPDSAANPRTPFGTDEPPLPANINGVAMQDLVNDPILLLQSDIHRELEHGSTFGPTTVLNIASQATVTFNTEVNSQIGGPTTTVTVADGNGGVENIPFLDGTPAGGPNAESAFVYATFWIETVHPRHRPPFMQLQYAQFVSLTFPIFTLANSSTPRVADLGWPHVSVATLRKTFNA